MKFKDKHSFSLSFCAHSQGRNVRLISMNARATLVITEARALISQMASLVIVHLAGWDPVVKSVSRITK